MKALTDDQMAKSAEFYGITMDEARARVAKCEAQGDDPTKPICVGCARYPEEIDIYVELGLEEGQSATEYVLDGEGTLNLTNGHFLCDGCYVRNGMPSSDRGWVCP